MRTVVIGDMNARVQNAEAALAKVAEDAGKPVSRVNYPRPIGTLTQAHAKLEPAH